MVCAIQEVHVIGRHEIEVHFPGDLDQLRVAAALGVDTVVVEFDEIALRAEDIAVKPGDLTSLPPSPREDVMIHLALEAPAEGDEAIRVLRQQLPVDTRLVVKTLEMGGTDEFDEIAVPLGILHEERQVIGGVTSRTRRLVQHGTRRDIGLTTHDRLHPGLLRRLEKLDRPEHVAVIRHGDGGHAERAAFLTRSLVRIAPSSSEYSV